ncbi:unknown [Bacteroides sp. CAG:144]|nr:unknown [Bacteroides sp. CAG:144]
MRRIHTGQQYRGQQTVLQQNHVCYQPDTYGYNKGQHSQYHRLSAILPKIAHVHFQSGQEHDIEQSYLTEQIEAAVSYQNIKTMLTHNDSRQNHSDNMRNMKFVQYDRSEQYYK